MIRRRVGFGAALTFLLGGVCVTPAMAATWGQFGLNPWHSSFNTAEKTLSRSNVAALKLEWSRAIPASSGGFATPVVGSGNVFTGPRLGSYPSTVRAYSAISGATQWTALTCDGSSVASLAYSASEVFDASIGVEMAAQEPVTGVPLDCADGAPFLDLAVVGITLFPAAHGSTAEYTTAAGTAWRYDSGSLTAPTSFPAIFKGTVYFATGSSLVALSQQDGSVIWSQTIDPGCGCLLSPSVAYAGSALYVGGGALYARSDSTGAAVWTQPAVADASTPALANGVLYVNSAAPTAPGLYAVQAATGKVLWRKSGIGATRSTPTVANGVVYDVSHSGALEMLNSTTGALIAIHTEPHGGLFAHSAASQVLVVNGQVIVVTNSRKATNYLDVFHA